MTVEKSKPKQVLRPITTGAASEMNQSQFLAITCNMLKAREKSRVQGAIGFGFASHWLKNWRDSFKPITQHSNCNHVITFDSHLKTALTEFGSNNNYLILCRWNVGCHRCICCLLLWSQYSTKAALQTVKTCWGGCRIQWPFMFYHFLTVVKLYYIF